MIEVASVGHVLQEEPVGLTGRYGIAISGIKASSFSAARSLFPVIPFAFVFPTWLPD